MQEINEINKCPYCQSSKIKKEGKRKNKLQTIQKYSCKDCNKNFTNKKLEHKTYPARIILNAVSYYNMGYSQQQTSPLISQKFKVRVPQRTISEWVNCYKTICTFNTLRKKATKLYTPKSIIFKKPLQHQQVYLFQYHKAKLYLLFHNILYNNQFTNISLFYEPLKAYLEKIPTTKFPHHIFKKEIKNVYNNKNKAISARGQLTEGSASEAQSSPNAEIAKNKNIISNKNNLINNKNKSEQRASQIKFPHLKIKHLSKINLATKLASLALNLATSNKDRHNTIQNFMLINDSTTIAIEVPVYLTNWDAGYYRNQPGFIFPLNNYTTPITGHIDLLQIRNGMIHILDYKPDAHLKQIQEQAIHQLTIYAIALSRKLNLPLYYFKCAWFDDKNYYEFFPLHVVYLKRYQKSRV